MRKLFIKMLLALMRWVNYSPYEIDEGILRCAKIATAEAERKGKLQSGQGKRAAALRMMMNMCPHEKERDLDWAIDICLRR